MDKKKFERTVLIWVLIAIVITAIASAVLAFYAHEILNEAQRLQEAIESKNEEIGESVSEESFHGGVKATLVSTY